VRDDSTPRTPLNTKYAEKYNLFLSCNEINGEIKKIGVRQCNPDALLDIHSILAVVSTTFLRKRSVPKKSLARTSASAEKSLPSPQATTKSVLKNQGKQHGRHFVPPMRPSVKCQRVKFLCAVRDLNPRPSRCKRAALPTELTARVTVIPDLQLFPKAMYSIL
jgi:hypothetical protein